MSRQLLSIGLFLALPVVASLAHGQQPLREFQGCDTTIRNVVFSPDGKRIAAASTSNEVLLWEVASAKPTHRLKGIGGWAISAAFSPDGKAVAATSWQNGVVFLWQLSAPKKALILKRHLKQMVQFVTFSPDGKRLASAGGGDGAVRVWDAATGDPIRVLDAHSGGALVVVYSPDGQRLASAGDDRRVKLWEASTGRLLQEYLGHTDSVATLAFTADGQVLYSGSHDGTIREWHVPSGKALRQWGTAGSGAVRTLALSPDGRSLAVANQRGTVQVWELATLHRRRLFRTDKAFSWAVAFAPDGKTLATGGADQVVRLWDVTAGWGTASAKSPLQDRELEGYWQDLGKADAGQAYTAVWALAARPQESVPFLTKQLQAGKTAWCEGQRRLTLLVEQLDHKLFVARDKAARELAGAGFRARPFLLGALRNNPSVEHRQRLEKLLDKISEVVPSAEDLQRTRALETLARIDSPAARQVLAELTAR